MTNRWVNGVLTSLVLFDTLLVIWAFALPDLWFRAFHHTDYDDPEGFLRRCGANWAAFALFQGVALAKWNERPVWLAVVAGVRLSDVFTDAVYVLFAKHTTWFAWVGLPPMLLFNAGLGIYFLRAYRWACERRSPKAGGGVAPDAKIVP